VSGALLPATGIVRRVLVDGEVRGLNPMSTDDNPLLV